MGPPWNPAGPSPPATPELAKTLPKAQMAAQISQLFLKNEPAPEPPNGNKQIWFDLALCCAQEMGTMD